ncbi:MAG: GNAT family N-acetyltransferase [Candidatus Nitrosocosmicus sp.]|nr:GNAT family N-acetyltransferase [Candidatus Nitrosocosmicus sp.]
MNDSRILFEDERLKPDMLKIYPTLVVRNTGLYKLYKEQKYNSYSTNQLVELLVEIKKIIPPWVRIMRIQREIEAPDIISGPKMGNIRQKVLEELKRQRIKCKCIRCREIGLYESRVEFSNDDVLLFRTEYNAANGKEIFLSFELRDRMLLLGFLRLRIMSDPLRKELQSEPDFMSGSRNNDILDLTDKSYSSAIVRELHVYGAVAKVGEQVNRKLSTTDNKKSNTMLRIGDNSNDNFPTVLNPVAIESGLVGNNQIKYQHKGLGRGLLAEAEKICREEYCLKKISVISAVGTRDYYRKFGYTNNGPYVTKLL